MDTLHDIGLSAGLKATRAMDQSADQTHENKFCFIKVRHVKSNEIDVVTWTGTNFSFICDSLQAKFPRFLIDELHLTSTTPTRRAGPTVTNVQGPWMSSSSWLKEEKDAGNYFHWWLYRHGDVVHVRDSRTTCWFPTHGASHGNLRLAVSVLIQPSAAGHGSPARRLNSPRPRSITRTAATDQEGGGGASLHDDRVTGETSDCCLLCTIIPNTWIILTPEISNCPFDESSHLCKVTCQFGHACFNPPFLYSPLPVTPPATPELPPSFLFHTSLPALTPAAHMERPYWEMHMSCCWESTRPASRPRDSPRVWQHESLWARFIT